MLELKWRDGLPLDLEKMGDFSVIQRSRVSKTTCCSLHVHVHLLFYHLYFNILLHIGWIFGGMPLGENFSCFQKQHGYLEWNDGRVKKKQTYKELYENTDDQLFPNPYAHCRAIGKFSLCSVKVCLSCLSFISFLLHLFLDLCLAFLHQ